jgi:Bacterial toxin 44
MRDELTPIADYMAHEMNTNAHGQDCRRMAELNSFSYESCASEFFKASWWRQLFGQMSPEACMDVKISSTEAALMMWGMLVRQNAAWDHKPKLHRFVSATSHSWAWHAYANTLYFYDIWSNVHYGYVGRAAGFSESVLLDGAGLEQMGSDLLRKRWPRRTVGIEGLRAWDDESDRAAIGLGVELYQVVPTHISAASMVGSILMTAGLSTKPAPLE